VDDLGRGSFLEKIPDDGGTQDARCRGITQDARIEMEDLHDGWQVL
jgi:hypothetical protein